ncbi:hypothetical protein Csa_004832 [Cucumis sativus]|uniref:Uncharacterized protein n=1 Tax=Cucumis sativus TaxID=3659 RepID=A0A0A0KFS5_CUCSA|nr:hypothetical protein Csa_004832 [Cucumis sativus]
MIRGLFVLSGFCGSKSFSSMLVDSDYVNLINTVNCEWVGVLIEFFVSLSSSPTMWLEVYVEFWMLSSAIFR